VFEIVVKPSASKEFARLPRRIQARFAKAIGELQHDPLHARPGLDIHLQQGPILEWRLRVGHYRATYVVDGSSVRITRFGHRSTMYR